MIINRESLLGRLGGQVGQGLASGLQYVGHQQQLQQNKNQLANTLRALNIPEEAVDLPEPILGTYIKQRMLNEARGLQYGEPTLQEIAGQGGQPINIPQQMQQPQQVEFQQQFPQQFGQAQQQTQRRIPSGVNPRAILQPTSRGVQSTKLTPEQAQDLEMFKNNKEQIGVLKDMYKLWKGGSVPAGRFGRAGEFLTGPSSAGQEFENLTKKLVQLRVQTLGNPTNEKLKFLEASKPNLNQNSDVQRRIILNDIKESQRQAREAFNRLPLWQQEELRRVGQAPGEETPAARKQEQEKQQARESEFEENPENKPEQEGWFDWISRNLERATEKAKRFYGPSEEERKEFDKWIEKIAPPKTAKEREFLEAVRKPSGEEPRGLGEEVFDNIVSSIPIFYAGGAQGLGSIGARLLKDVVGTTASTSVKRQGGGVIPQFIAGVGAGVGANKIASAFKRGVKLSHLKSAAEAVKNESYATEAKLGKNINAPAPKYQKALQSIEDEIGTGIGLESKQRQELLNKITELKSDIKDHKINAAKLIERDKTIYGTYDDFNKVGKNYLTRIHQAITDQADNMAKGHKKWHEAWKTGSDINNALHWKSALYRKIDANPKIADAVTSKLALGLLSGGASIAGLAFAPGASIGAAVGAGGLNKLGRVISFAVHKNPNIKKLAKDAIEKTLEGTAEETIRAYSRLSKATKKYDGLLEEESNPSEMGL